MASWIVRQNLFLKRAKRETSYLVRILLYGEVHFIIEQLKLDSLILKNQFEIIGIFTADNMHWQNEVQHTRILLDHESFFAWDTYVNNQIAEIRIVHPWRTFKA